MLNSKRISCAKRSKIVSWVVAFTLLHQSATTVAQARPNVDESASPIATSGEELFQLVQSYSNLGNHRVGTDVDARTIEWFANELERRGGNVKTQPFTFDRFDGSSIVTIDGVRIPSIPLFYEGVGEIQSDAPFVATKPVMNGHRDSKELLDAIDQAKESGAEIAVIATENSGGYLTTPNRTPKIASGLPVVLVPGRYGKQLTPGHVEVTYSAKIANGKSDNVVATLGDSTKKPIVLATPLSGWFRCAAERGTGIAVTLALAERLSANHHVVVVGSPGHELLPHIGLEAFLKNHQLDPAVVVHLGANVALGTKDPETGEIHLAPGINDFSQIPSAARTVFVRMSPDAFAKLRQPLSEADLPAVLNPPHWHGEASLWAEAVESPLLSFTGIGPQFHTPADVPEDVTSPALLETVYRAIGNAIEVYLKDHSEH